MHLFLIFFIFLFRCGVITTLSHPYCFNCCERYYNVRVNTSTIANAGYGLFAYDKNRSSGELIFNKNDYICPYVGEYVSEEELDKRYTLESNSNIICPYAVQLQNGKYIDGAIVRGIANYGNDNGKANNADLREMDGDIVYACATKKIYNGEEIFIDYGSSYWNGESLHHETK